jgi:hypothetical protein
MKKTVYTIFTFVTLFLFVNSSFAQVEPISTDRPDQAESPNVIPLKTFQIEVGVLYDENNQDGTKIKNLFYPSMLLRYGLLNNLELRMEIDNVKSTTDSAGTSSSANNISFATIGAKLNIVKGDGLSPSAGFIINFTIPSLTSVSANTDYVGTSINLALQNNFTDEFSAGYNIGAVWAGNTPEPSFFYTLSLGYELSKRFNGFVEVFGFLPEKSKANHVLDFGLSFLALNNLSFDASAGVGLTDNSPNFFVNGGFSFRLPK